MKPPYRHDWLGSALWLAAAFMLGMTTLAFALLIRAAIAHWSHP